MPVLKQFMRCHYYSNYSLGQDCHGYQFLPQLKSKSTQSIKKFLTSYTYKRLQSDTNACSKFSDLANISKVNQHKQQFIVVDPLPYSIQSIKSKYQPAKIEIFGEEGIFLGDMINGKPHGPGQIYFFNQNFLEAIFSSGQIYSEDAILIQNNGNFYRGGFKDSIQTGAGHLRTSGCEWKGQFISGRISGTGQLKSQDGNQYQGQFSNGKMEGKGILRYKNGDFYQGYFKQGKRQGIGYLRQKNYEYYGPFEKDMKEGKGTLILKYDAKFEGWFSRDKLHGYGQYHNSKGIITKYNYQYAQIHTLF